MVSGPHKLLSFTNGEERRQKVQMNDHIWAEQRSEVNQNREWYAYCGLVTNSTSPCLVHATGEDSTSHVD